MNKKLMDIMKDLRTITFRSKSGESITITPEAMSNGEGIGIAYTTEAEESDGTNVGASLGFYMTPKMLATTIEGLTRSLGKYAPHLLIRMHEKNKELIENTAKNMVQNLMENMPGGLDMSENNNGGALNALLKKLGFPDKADSIDDTDPEPYGDVDTSSIDEVL